MEKLYYWEDLVKEVESNKIILDNGEEIIMTSKEQELVLSTEPLELWKFTYTKASKLAWEILDLLEWYENIVKKSDIQYILEYLVSSIKGNFETASAKAMGIYNEETAKKYWTWKLIEEISLKDIKKFL